MEWGAREGVCDNEKRRTTSVFARCSFCDPHLALRHGGRNREEGIYQERGGTREGGGRKRESKRVCAWGGTEIQHTHMRRKREREAGRGKKAPRSRHSFTEIICRKGAAHTRCVCACGCMRARTFVFLWVCAASYLFSAGSWLLCTPLCSSDKTLFHSPSTMPYQSPNRNPDCNSLLNLNAH